MCRKQSFTTQRASFYDVYSTPAKIQAMNFLSVRLTALETPSLSAPGASPFLDQGTALHRLSGADPVFAGAASVMQPMLDMTWQMLQMLTMLMLGSASNAGASGGGIERQQSANASDSGARIQGGKSNYAHGMFHKGDKGAPNTYAFENSPAGIKFAAEHGYSSIDLDMQITKDGVPVATHWSEPMKKDGFFDPEHKLSPGTKVSQMTLAEVMRLRNKDGQSRIYPVSTMLAELKKHGIAGDLEAKNDPRFASDAMMGQLADMVRKSGVKANLKSINYGPRSMNILKEAQQQGFWVRTAHGAGHGQRNLGYGS